MSISPKPSGLSSTTAGKAKIIARTKALINKSQMIIALPFEGVTMENTDILRRMLPENITASVVKNALIRKSVEGTDFSVLADNLKHETMFMFCPEGTAKEGFKAFQKWQREVKRTDPQFSPRAVVLENQKFVGAEVEEIACLPTKKEYMLRLCLALQSVPQSLARALKAIPTSMSKTFEELMAARGAGVDVPNATVLEKIAPSLTPSA